MTARTISAIQIARPPPIHAATRTMGNFFFEDEEAGWGLVEGGEVEREAPAVADVVLETEADEVEEIDAEVEVTLALEVDVREEATEVEVEEVDAAVLEVELAMVEVVRWAVVD
jgi:hypothetical protein